MTTLPNNKKDCFTFVFIYLQKKSMKKITSFLYLFLSSFAFSQSYSGPESVEYDYSNSRWLIANTTSHQVLARSSSGTLTVFATLTGTGPYGIEIVGDVLYCCNGASVKGYSLTNGANVFSVNVGASFLNGITHDNSGNLYVTDFSGKKIYKIVIATSTFSTIATGLGQSPNGMVYDEANNRCVFANWGANAPIKAIDLTTFAVTTLITTNHSNIDGISRDGAGNYYISTWGGQNVLRYDSAFANAPVSIATGLSNPADISINVVDNVLAIPNSGNNTVTFVNLNLNTDAFGQNELKSISVSPNPIVSHTTLKFELSTLMKVSAEIINLEGKKVGSINFNNEILQNGSVDLDLSYLNSGVYYLVFKAGTNSKTIPLLVN
jgi:sugar lactone lactonase YvrE